MINVSYNNHHEVYYQVVIMNSTESDNNNFNRNIKKCTNLLFGIKKLPYYYQWSIKFIDNVYRLKQF